MPSIEETLKPVPEKRASLNGDAFKSLKNKELEALDILSDNPELRRQSAERIAQLMLEIDQKL